MNRKIYVATAILVIIAAALGWYYFVYTKTPEYSLKMIGEAVNTHDVNKFKKHVDLDSVVSRAVDDFADYSLKKLKEDSNGNELSNALVDGLGRGLFMAVKPEINNSLKKKIISAVETGEWKSESVKNSSREPKEAEGITESTALKTAKYGGVKYVEKRDAVAAVGVDVIVPGLDEPFTIVLKMRKLEDGMWQISEIENFMDYVKVIAELRKKELNEYISKVKKIQYDNDVKFTKYRKEHPRDVDPVKEKEIKIALQAIELEKYSQLLELPVPDGAKELGQLIKDSAHLHQELYGCYEPGTSRVKDDPKTQIRHWELKKKIEENNSACNKFLKKDKNRLINKGQDLLIGTWKDEKGATLEIGANKFGLTVYDVSDVVETEENTIVQISITRGRSSAEMIFPKDNRDMMTLVNPITNYTMKYTRVR